MLKLNGAWLCGLSSVPQGSGLSRLRSSPSQITNLRLRLTNVNEIWECSTIHSLADRSRPLLSPPPPSHRVASRCVASRRVVPRPCLSRLRCRSEGTAASPHPSPSRQRRGKIPSIAVVLRSDDDASRRPPPPLVASSNICFRSRQRDSIAASTIVAAARRTSILAKNAAAALLLARGALFPTAAVADAVPPTPPRLATLAGNVTILDVVRSWF